MVSYVMQNFRLDVTTYTLPLVFGFAIMPEHTTFAHSIVLEASLADIGKTFRLIYCKKTLHVGYKSRAKSCSWRSPFVPRGQGLAGLCDPGSI